MAGFHGSPQLHSGDIFPDDALLYFGNSNDVTLVYDTVDANAHTFKVSLGAGAATHVPVVAIGVGINDVDLGAAGPDFSSVTQTTLAIIDADRDTALVLDYSADDAARLRTIGTTRDLTIAPTGQIIIPDDTVLNFGTSQDIAFVERSSALTANTALTDVLVGTPVSAATPADSLLISNITANGDIALFTLIGGTNSAEIMRVDTSAGLVVWNEGGTADIDHRWEGTGNANLLMLDWGLAAVGIGAAATSGQRVLIANAGTPLNVQNTTNAASVTALILSNARATPTAGDKVILAFFQNDSAAASVEYATISVEISDPVAASKDAKFYFNAQNAGGVENILHMGFDLAGTGAFVFNDTGRDMDFRYEGQSASYAFFMDAGLGGFALFGRNTAMAPDTQVHIWAATAGVVSAIASTLLTLENSGSAFIDILAPTSGGIYVGDTDNDVGSLIYVHSTDTWTITAGTVVAVDILATGVAVAGGLRIFSNSATEIGIQVTNGALTVGSLGSLVIPVKTDTGAPLDAAAGNLDGSFAYNSFDNTLEIRDGVDTYLSVGVAGYVIQRRVPLLLDKEAWYHPLQYRDKVFADETRCVVCGEEMQPGEQITFWANGRVRNNDLHAIFGHLHPERDSYVQQLEARIVELEAKCR